MALYEITAEGLQAREVAQFAALGMYERADLQRLLRDKPAALGEDLLVISEEFGQWEDAKRRIDLLAIDRAGRLVVIELKRTDDGGHMELQALRYAAMVSSMTFDEAVSAYTAHRGRLGLDQTLDARAELESFLAQADAADDGDEPVISPDVRIILVSANFGREITTAVLWLNRFDGMDIRCVRLVPYELDGKILLDIQQVIPLPEAADYQVKIRRKEAALQRATRSDGRDFTQYHVVVDGIELPAENKRNAIRVMVRELVNKGVPLADIRALLPARMFRVLPGQLTTGDAVRDALATADPAVQMPRWFTDHAWYDQAADQTYVLYKMWGRNTEPTLATLTAAFPATKITYSAAEDTE